MVLGAGVLANGNLSAILNDRAKTAVELYRAHKIKLILVTGNNVSKDTNEVTPIKNYLLKNGIPAKVILTDDKGVDTYSSVYNAKVVYHINSLIIITQKFHLSRAVYIARSLGLDAYGMAADNGAYLLKNSLREFLADPKAIYDVIMARVVRI